MKLRFAASHFLGYEWLPWLPMVVEIIHGNIRASRRNGVAVVQGSTERKRKR